MKKILLNIFFSLMLINAFSQERLYVKNDALLTAPLAITVPCTPTQTLSINTGLNASGGLISPGTADPFWGGVAIPNMTGVYANWNKIPGTAILSPNIISINKPIVFRRYFYLCKESKVDIKGVFRCDNVAQKIEIIDAGGVKWSQTPPNTPPAQCWADIGFSGSAVLSAGQCYVEFTYTNYGSYGGFALAATLTASSAVLANFKDCCCDCSRLPQKPVISGPTCFCLSKPCDQMLTYNVPNYGGQPCFTYEWSVKNAAGGAVNVAGQGTNQIKFNCNSLQAGIYNITVIIKCGGRVVTNTIQLIVCNKPDPGFSMSSNGNDVTFTSLNTGTDYWFLVKDNDNNCAYTAGETYQFSATNPATFTGLVNSQQYTVYHFVFKKCGENCFCWSSKMMCFKWLPSQMMKTANGARGVESLKEKELLKLDEIPAQFKKDLPREIWSVASETKDFKEN
jgi:hypothetical protein